MSARRTAVAVLVATLMGGGLAAVAAPADAANPRCMSRTEYRKIHNGQTVATVARIVGSKGRVSAQTSTGGYRFVMRDFKACTAYGWGNVTFEATPGRTLRVTGKAVSW